MGWTGIDVDTSWQDLTIAQEIATAYNKRVAALTATEQTATGVSAITPAETMTVYDFVLAVQTGIEAMATYWAAPDGSGLQDNFASVAAAMSDAGLTESGYWRRIAEGGTQPSAWTTYNAAGWSYGKITDKDLAGPWLWIDIQNALENMKRRAWYLKGAAGYNAAIDAGVTGSFEQSVYNSEWETSYPTPPSFDIDSATSGIYEEGFYGAAKLRNGPASNWTYSTQAACFRNILTVPCSSHTKNVRLLGKYDYVFLNDSPLWATGFGLNPTYATVVEIDSVSSNTATSVELKNLPAITAWGDLLDYIPWPSDPASEGDYKINSEDLKVTDMCVIVDYQFDP